MNSDPLSESIPCRRNGNCCRMWSSASWTTCWLLPMTARVSTQVVWMSVRFNECMNSPSARSPECATKSISVKPGTWTSQRSVFSGIWCFRSVPGFVRPYCRFRSSCLNGRKARSIWRGLILRSRAATSSAIGQRRIAHGSQIGSNAFSRTDQGQPAASQIRRNVPTTTGPYCVGRPGRRRRVVGGRRSNRITALR